MRLDLQIGTFAAAAALCLPVVAYGQRPVVEGMSQRLTVACGTEGAKVQGMGNTVTLTGTCATVLVEGSDNTVHIAVLGRLTVAHMPVRVTVLPIPWTFAPSVPHATVRRWDMPSTTGRWP